MLDKIFWTVQVNKIRRYIQKYKILRFFELQIWKYKDTFKKSNDNWKYYLIFWPILNIFIFSWFFAFVIIMISNFIIFNKINQK